jgi:hypothetical protein
MFPNVLLAAAVRLPCGQGRRALRSEVALLRQIVDDVGGRARAGGDADQHLRDAGVEGVERAGDIESAGRAEDAEGVGSSRGVGAGPADA